MLGNAGLLSALQWLASPCLSRDSHHAAGELVDELLAVAPGTTVLEGVSLLLETLVGGRELEGPQEVVGLLEVWADSPDLVDEVLDGVDAVLAETSLNNGVIGERDSRSVDLAEASLVDELANSVTGRVAVGDQGLDRAKHVPGSLVQTHEDSVMELAKTQKLHDLLGLGSKLVDTDQACQNGAFTYPLVLMANAIFGWPSTKKLPAALAARLASTSALSAAAYS